MVSTEGEVLRRVDVTDGERFHPGGFTMDSATVGSPGCWIAVAEYRPRSTTTVMRLDAELATVESFPFDDHLGAICALTDGTLFAVSWASRRWYRLDAAGRILEQRNTPSRWVDLQDIAHVTMGIDGEQVVATGVGGLQAPTGPVQLGGLVVIDVDALTIEHDTPVAAWMPSGRHVGGRHPRGLSPNGPQTRRNPLQCKGFLVREGGLEPPRPFGHQHLKLARLPFRHSRKWSTER